MPIFAENDPGPRTMRTSVAVAYNNVGKDEYENLKEVDPSSLGFKAEYSLQVSTAQEEYDHVVSALASEGFHARSWNIRDDLKALVRLLARNPPDVVFNLVEHFREDSMLEAAVAGLYELHGVPYTGASPFALGLCVRKGLTKQVLLANGVPTPRFKLLGAPAFPKRHGLRYPLIVKPAREDASAGVDKDSVVFDYDALGARLAVLAEKFAAPYLVEEFVAGSELHVSILGNGAAAVVLPVIEFDFSELPDDYPKIISYDAKWNPLEEAYHRVHSVCPARISRRIQRTVEEFCLKAYRITGCRDYARIDLRLDAKGKPYILDVNPNPDLTEGVSFMESAERAGLSFSRTLRMIVEYALSRRGPA